MKFKVICFAINFDYIFVKFLSVCIIVFVSFDKGGNKGSEKCGVKFDVKWVEFLYLNDEL